MATLWKCAFASLLSVVAVVVGAGVAWIEYFGEIKPDLSQRFTTAGREDFTEETLGFQYPKDWRVSANPSPVFDLMATLAPKGQAKDANLGVAMSVSVVRSKKGLSDPLSRIPEGAELLGRRPSRLGEDSAEIVEYVRTTKEGKYWRVLELQSKNDVRRVGMKCAAIGPAALSAEVDALFLRYRKTFEAVIGSLRFEAAAPTESPAPLPVN
jgi:hypothetical protein